MEKISKNIYSIVFCVFLILMLSLTLISAVHDVYSHIFDPENAFAEYDFSNAYPIDITFSDYQKQVAECLHTEVKHETPSSAQAFSNPISDFIEDFEGAIENRTNTNHILCKGVFIEGKTKLDKMMGLDLTASSSSGKNKPTEIGDVIVHTKENQLGWIMDNADIDGPLNNIIAFGLQMEAKGKHFLTILPPNKYAETAGFTDYSQKQTEHMLAHLDEYGIAYFDVGSYFKGLGLTEKDIFFDTDHHWKPSSGILACKYLSEYLNQNCGYDIDTAYFDLDRYFVNVLEKAFLGSSGRRVSRAYTQMEDFMIYDPQYDSQLEVKNYGTNTDLEGTIKDTLFNYATLQYEDVYSSDLYWFYGYGDRSLIEIHNRRLHNGSRILMVKNSFANCMYPYFSQACEYLDVVDLRHFDGSLEKYIENTNPDTVIVVMSMSTMLRNQPGGACDFR